MHLRASLYIVSILLAGATVQRAVAQPFVPARNAQCVAFSPEGDLLATGISGMSNDASPLRPHPSPRKCAEIKIWDAETYERLRRLEWYGDITRLAFSPDGKRLAGARLFRTIDGLDLNQVHVWDVETGDTVRAFERTHAFDFSPDGQTIVVVSRRSCSSFDLDSGERRMRYKPLGGALSVRYTPDGKQLVGIVQSEDGYQLVSCDTQTGEMVAEGVAFEEPFYSLEISRHGALIATGHDGGNVLVWKVDGLQPLKRFQSGATSRQRPVFSPDGKTIACCGQAKSEVAFFDVASGREIRRMRYDRGTFATYFRRDREETLRPESDPARFAFSPDGTLFFAGCYGGILRRMDTGNEVKRLE